VHRRHAAGVVATVDGTASAQANRAAHRRQKQVKNQQARMDK
jgi:hypothetical protein